MNEFIRYLKKDIVNDKKQAKVSTRVLYLDVIKLLSAFLVVFYHYAYYSLDYGFTPGIIYLPNINRLIMSFAACSVPLFFIVNGALMFSRKRSITSILYKIFKICLLLIVWSRIHFPNWFFETMLILFVLYPVLYYIWSTKKTIFYIIIGCVICFPFLYNEFSVISKIIYPNNLSITGAKTMYSLAYFCLGIVLLNGKKWKKRYSVLVSCIGYALLVFDNTYISNYEHAMADGVRMVPIRNTEK